MKVLLVFKMSAVSQVCVICVLLIRCSSFHSGGLISLNSFYTECVDAITNLRCINVAALDWCSIREVPLVELVA